MRKDKEGKNIVREIVKCYQYSIVMPEANFFLKRFLLL